MKPLSICRRRMHGLSLVELMVALTIGLIILTAVSSLFVSSKQTYTTQDSLARLQENARFAMQFLIKDIRLGGYFGCLDEMYAPSPGIAVAGGLTFVTNATVPFEGAENASGTWLPSGAALPAGMKTGTDAIAIRMSNLAAWANVTPGMLNGSSNINVDSVTPFAVGDIAVVSDCASADITQVSGISGSALVHSMALQKAYEAPAARVFKMVTRQYFIGTKTVDGKIVPVLYRQDNAGAPQELVEGVESLQILYGEDTDTPPTGLTDGVPNIYRKASAVVNWQKVISVRIGILVSTLDEKNTDVDTTPSYDVDGDGSSDFVPPSTPPDRHRRRVFQATVQLRNML
jgi:type IV pilus assembly protein PilW